ncbi:nuclear transport factor 2 family protein [Arthrobacter sp. NPDC057013]|uniref:nuclear transport factor 2 family protein n=1 Tax=Arthrobacter sp. NPDC057013 TaxID=3345999 RepID=UPI00362C7F94
MPAQHSSDEQDILSLEDSRYEAVLRADFEAFADLCHKDLVYAHSNGDRDDLGSYMEKCRQGVYVYHRIDHPVEQVKIIGDVALVMGEMHADLTIRGTQTSLDNTALAVWVRSGSSWKLLAYQPTPKPGPAALGQQSKAAPAGSAA